MQVVLRSASALVLAALLWCAGGRAHAQRTETPGPAIVQVIGSQAGGIGLQLGYYFIGRHNPWGLYTYGSVGTVADDDWTFGGVLGVTGLYGEQHRWALDASFGLVGVMHFTLYGEQLDTRPIYGVSLQAGREWMWSTGLLFRALIGATYTTDAAAIDFDERFGLALTLGFGWKPW